MSELKPCPFEDWWNKEVLHGKSTSFVGIDVHSMRWWTRLAFEAGMNNRPESEAERVLREWGESVGIDPAKDFDMDRYVRAGDTMHRLAIKLACETTTKGSDDDS